MELTQKLENWTATHHPAWFDFIRMAVGLFLFIKGFIVLGQIMSVQTFINNINLLNNFTVGWNAHILVQIIAYIHIIGGLFIAIGLLTRLAIFFQIPILIGAVLFASHGVQPGAGANMAQGGVLFAWTEANMNTLGLEWWTALITLILLIACFIMGSGPWSVDKYLEHYEEE